MREIIIQENQCGQRLDKFLFKYMKQAPKGFLYKMLRKKNIKLNGRRAEGNEQLQRGDVLTLYLAEETLQKFSAECLEDNGRGETEFPPLFRSVEILYENEHVILMNKPAGVLSQRAAADDVSMVEYLKAYVGSTEAGFSPGLCNRLDRNTSGIVIGGKTLRGLQTMSELFRERKIEKYYIAVVCGRMDTEGIVEGWLRKDGKTNQAVVSKEKTAGSSYIKTGYRSLGTDGTYTVLRVRLFTGKTHQIRSHLASISHPVAGDVKYGGRIRGKTVSRQLLHSYEVRFPKMESPFCDLSGKTFRARLPEDFYREEAIGQLLQKASLG